MSELQVARSAYARDRRGDPLGALIAAQAGELIDGDVVVVLAEGRLEGRGPGPQALVGDPSAEARRLRQCSARNRGVQLVLEESAHLIRAERSVLIVETKHGFVCANAGIDSSNLAEDDTVLLLPEDQTPRRASAPNWPRQTGARARRRRLRQLRPRLAPRQADVGDRLRRAAPLDDWRGATTPAAAPWRRP